MNLLCCLIIFTKKMNNYNYEINANLNELKIKDFSFVKRYMKNFY